MCPKLIFTSVPGFDRLQLSDCLVELVNLGVDFSLGVCVGGGCLGADCGVELVNKSDAADE